MMTLTFMINVMAGIKFAITKEILSIIAWLKAGSQSEANQC